MITKAPVPLFTTIVLLHRKNWPTYTPAERSKTSYAWLQRNLLRFQPGR